MKIRWYGQSTFVIEAEKVIVIDPFSPKEEWGTTSEVRFEYPPIGQLEADLLLITHEDFDHNAARVVIGSPTIVRSTAGTFESPIGQVVAVASEHDAAAGIERGPNTIFRFRLGGLHFCHLGDLGQVELRPAQADAIGHIDVLFLPVGGGPTVGGTVAAAIAKSLRPRLVVPMHYRTHALNFLELPDDFLDAFGAPVERLESNEFSPTAYMGTHDQPMVVLPAPPWRA